MEVSQHVKHPKFKQHIQNLPFFKRRFGHGDDFKKPMGYWPTETCSWFCALCPFREGAAQASPRGFPVVIHVTIVVSKWSNLFSRQAALAYSVWMCRSKPAICYLEWQQAICAPGQAHGLYWHEGTYESGLIFCATGHIWFVNVSLQSLRVWFRCSVENSWTQISWSTFTSLPVHHWVQELAALAHTTILYPCVDEFLERFRLYHSNLL